MTFDNEQQRKMLLEMLSQCNAPVPAARMIADLIDAIEMATIAQPAPVKADVPVQAKKRVRKPKLNGHAAEATA